MHALVLFSAVVLLVVGCGATHINMELENNIHLRTIAGRRHIPLEVRGCT